MIRIAVIGGIGSGKSFISKLLVTQFSMQIMKLNIFIKKIKPASIK